VSRRLIVTGGTADRELVLVDTLIVGRDPACEISELNDPLLSRRHAAFTATAREAMVRDLGSRNGILVNGAKAAQAVLRHGDVVQIGHLQVRYVDEVGPFVDLPSAAEATRIVSAPNTDHAATVVSGDTKKLPL
jgi:pSer/pThr/pTyr-binding forkhead associated (FHA) protein